MAIAHIAAGIELKEEHHGPVAYEFHYSVHDPHTGDIKSQKEVRKDDKVEGVYELIDSDGHHRIVTYKADDHSGFEAVVIRKPTDIKIPQPESHGKILTHAKILAPAPLVHYAAIKPAIVAKPILEHGHSAEYGNFVSFSGPSHNYKY